MAARTSGSVGRLVVCAALGVGAALSASGPARGEEPARSEETAYVLGDDGVRLEALDLRLSLFDQAGHGYQSRAGVRTAPMGASAEPGAEDAYIVQPMAHLRVRQSERVVHDVTIPVDIVSAASADALDAISSASRLNEGGGVDWRVAYRQSDVTTVLGRVEYHEEEPIAAGTVGGGVRRALAQDNAALAITGSLTIDGRDYTNQYGDYVRKAFRTTVNANVSFTQILSPTTVFDTSYGFTTQAGTLQNSWNAVPVMGAPLVGEIFPRTRARHAVAARVAQHVPWTHTTLKAWYRYYRDDFGVAAHTVELAAYQYLVPWLYVRGSYRFHTQTGARFFTTGLAATPMDNAARTADSDLAPLDADELGLELVLVGERTPHGWGRHHRVGLSFFHYQRTNDLTATVLSLAYGSRF